MTETTKEKLRVIGYIAWAVSGGLAILMYVLFTLGIAMTKAFDVPATCKRLNSEFKVVVFVCNLP